MMRSKTRIGTTIAATGVLRVVFEVGDGDGDVGVEGSLLWSSKNPIVKKNYTLPCGCRHEGDSRWGEGMNPGLAKWMLQ
jgi:hypothetical protein